MLIRVDNINQSHLITAPKQGSVDWQTKTRWFEINIAYLLASSFNRKKRELIGSTAVRSLTPLWAAFIDLAVDADDRWNIHTSTPWSRPNFTRAAGNVDSAKQWLTTIVLNRWLLIYDYLVCLFHQKTSMENIFRGREFKIFSNSRS